MTLQDEINCLKAYNTAANIIFNLIGDKPWFQGVSKRIEPTGDTYCFITLNKKVDPTELLAIPEIISDVKIEIRYYPPGFCRMENNDIRLFR